MDEKTEALVKAWDEGQWVFTLTYCSNHVSDPVKLDPGVAQPILKR